MHIRMLSATEETVLAQDKIPHCSCFSVSFRFLFKKATHSLTLQEVFLVASFHKAEFLGYEVHVAFIYESEKAQLFFFFF